MKKLVFLFIIGIGIGFLFGCSQTSKVETSIVDDTQVFVSPSNGMAFQYVMESGRHKFEFLIGIIAIMVVLAFVYGMISDRIPTVGWSKSVLAISLVLAGFGLWRSIAAVSSDNAKPVSKAVWNWYKGQKEGEKRFWDSVYHSNRMLNNTSK